MPTIKIDGVAFPVTAAWHASVIAPYPEMGAWDHDQLELERTRLLELSNETPARIGQRRNVWTPETAARLDAVTHVINVHRATRWLEGRSHEEFNFTGVDQIHGNSCTHACGCTTQHLFDHHKRHGPPESLVVHPHDPRVVCEMHKPHLPLGLAAFHAKVHEDNYQSPDEVVTA
jgi:hypothetical protein